MRFFDSIMVRWVLLSVVAIYFVVISVSVLKSPSYYQWDFKTYYFAARLVQNGGNPYDAKQLVSISGGEAHYPFVYTPVIAILLGALPTMNMLTAYYMFYFVKIACFLALCYLWKKYFLVSASVAGFFLILAFGFREAIGSDLRAGNISVFEQLGIWVSMLWFLRKEYWKFGMGIITLSLVKVLPVVFLLLLVLTPGRAQVRHFFVCTVVFLALMVFQAIVSPGLFHSFISAVLSVSERAPTNPSLLAVIQDAGDHIQKFAAVGPQMLSTINGVLYGLLATGLLAVAMRRILRPQMREETIVMIFAVTLAVMMPRFKDYSYALLVVPAVQAVSVPRSVVVKSAVLILVCVTFVLYQQLLAAFAVWIILLRHGSVSSAPFREETTALVL